jgi:hypothetical protein
MSLLGKLQSYGALILNGSRVVPAKAGTTDGIIVLLKDRTGKALLAYGTDVPADTTNGYAKGCLFIDTNVATGTTGLYCNKGTSSAAVFTAVTQA